MPSFPSTQSPIVARMVGFGNEACANLGHWVRGTFRTQHRPADASRSVACVKEPDVGPPAPNPMERLIQAARALEHAGDIERVLHALAQWARTLGGATVAAAEGLRHGRVERAIAADRDDARARAVDALERCRTRSTGQERVATEPEFALAAGFAEAKVLTLNPDRPEGRLVLWWDGVAPSGIGQALDVLAGLASARLDALTFQGELDVAKERFEYAERASRGFVYEWDRETGHVFRSEGFHRILGYAPGDVRADQLLTSLESAGLVAWEWHVADRRLRLFGPVELLFGRAHFSEFLDRVDAGERERVQARLDAAVAGAGAYDVEYNFTRPDGRQVWLRDTGRVRRSGSGRAEVLTGITMDVTTRRRVQHATELLNQVLERKVEERTARLNETVNDLEAFSYSVAHNMRAPLRAMQGYAETILTQFGQGLETDCREYLNRIERAAARLDLLIRDLLDYSHVVRTEWALEPIEVTSVIEDAIATDPKFQWPLAQIEVAPGLPLVKGHPAALSQVVTNLLENAVKFVTPGTLPHVRVSWECVGSKVRVWIVDNGIGVPAEARDRIFDMFQRVHPRETYPGTGIGLSIVRKAVERMGGTVGCEAGADGSGSRFWIELAAAEPSR